jgi:hypothetical protein
VDRGALCWAGSSECTVPISATITRWDKAAAIVANGDDLPSQLRGGDWVQVAVGCKLRLVPKSNTAVSTTRLAFALSGGKVQLDSLHAAACGVLLVQAVKSFDSNATTQMKTPFEKHVTSGDMDSWDVSLLTALLANSNHRFLKSQAEVDIIGKLRDARNGVAHLKKSDVSQDTYDAGIALIESFCSDVMRDPEELTSVKAALDRLWKAESQADLKDTIAAVQQQLRDTAEAITERDATIAEQKAALRIQKCAVRARRAKVEKALPGQGWELMPKGLSGIGTTMDSTRSDTFASAVDASAGGTSAVDGSGSFERPEG